MYLIVKHSHLVFVVITVVLFNLRFWMRTILPSSPVPKVLRFVPHINDTLLLFTGMMLMTITRYVPFGNADWLGVKLILVVLYVLVGMFCLKSPPRSANGGSAMPYRSAASAPFIGWPRISRCFNTGCLAD